VAALPLVALMTMPAAGSAPGVDSLLTNDAPMSSGYVSRLPG